MSAGILFVRLYYPDLLHLKVPSAYLLTANSRRSAVRLVKHHKFLQILDLTNSMIPESEDSPHFKPHHDIVFGSEKRRDFRIGLGTEEQIEEYKKSGSIDPRIGHKATFTTQDDARYQVFETRYATEIIVSYEIEDIQSPSTTDQDFYQEVVDEFVSIYRHAGGDYRPRELKDCREPMSVYIGGIEYKNDDSDKDIDQRLSAESEIIFKTFRDKFNYDRQPFSEPTSADEITTNVQSFLRESKNSEPWQGFLGAARHAAYQTKNFKYAILEAFISAEILISDFLKRKKLDAGVSKSKLDDYEREVGISYMINIELPMAIGNQMTQDDRKLLGCVDKVRKNRNDIIHNGKVPNEQEARYAVESVEKLLKFLQNHRG